MKKRKKKNAITLLALVITIVIMLLLAGVAIQMTMGENGLIAKSVQAQKEQAKAELYDTAKLSYTNLKAKALENGEASPQAELALSTTEFTNKYNVVGDDITDKKGTVIDTKENVLKAIMGETSGSTTTGGSVTPGTTTPAESWPKTVGGVTIPEEDKEKMILKFVVKNDTAINFYGTINTEIDYGNGETGTITTPISKQYNRGEYILKVRDFNKVSIEGGEDFEIEILQWGKITESHETERVEISNVSKIYEPEPDRIPITYINGKFTEIPEWLVSKKIISRRMSVFYNCKGITSIPEELFKNNVKAEDFNNTFNGCTGLTSIPEGLFKNNVNATSFYYTFNGCTGLTSIPEGLFKNNVNAKKFEFAFADCTGLTSIPEGLFKNNVKAENFGNTFMRCTGLTSIPEGLFKNNVNVTNFWGTFYRCTGLTSIPEGLFKNNVNVTNFWHTFGNCTGLTSIPEGLFKNNVNAKYFDKTFSGCTALTSIPEGLFKNNVKVEYFGSTFYYCKGITSIPEGLFKNNVNVTSFTQLFEGCIRMQNIPEDIIELGKKVKEKGGNVSRMFNGCTSASNYNSLPNYIKN